MSSGAFLSLGGMAPLFGRSLPVIARGAFAVRAHLAPAQPIPLQAVERQAVTSLQQRIAERLTELLRLDWRIPAGNTSQKQLCPHVIVFHNGDEGLCLELAAEFLEILDTGPTLRVDVDPGGLMVFNTYASTPKPSSTTLRRC
ncbi:hypothetical protein [Deinococcus budaensis]|uniref:Uncharacterized protein n=1 Tax=Deinococcus budaensis TaxID=1665626 RepID=A0A7W8GET4_9DEIO|nr:hypothetical protein [Deinococcus budaensis]MBB5234235.1 hypothetical protein [Deinococcus budaensis]